MSYGYQMQQNSDEWTYGMEQGLNAYGNNANFLPPNPSQPGGGATGVRRIAQPDDNNAEKSGNVLAVVVTVNNGSSYDPLFTDHPQEMQDGVVRVYSCQYDALPILRKYLTTDDAVRDAIDATADEKTLGVVDELVTDIAAVDREAVVLNFECCGCCSDSGFPSSKHAMELTRLAIDRGFMVMFSDYSLKALIGAWDAALLGPNPFARTGELNTEFELRFDVKRLQADSCPSAQLTKVAELCNDGVARVSAMGGTIMYSVLNEGKAPAGAPYELEVLTLCTRADGRGVEHPQVISAEGVDIKGLAGHVSLRYPSGGVLLTSCGHWVSLCHLDTSETNLKAAVTKQMGAEDYAQWDAMYQAAPRVEQAAMLQSKAAECVRRSAPCKYSKY